MQIRNEQNRSSNKHCASSQRPGSTCRRQIWGTGRGLRMSVLYLGRSEFWMLCWQCFAIVIKFDKVVHRLSATAAFHFSPEVVVCCTDSTCHVLTADPSALIYPWPTADVDPTPLLSDPVSEGKAEMVVVVVGLQLCHIYTWRFRICSQAIRIKEFLIQAS